MHFASYLQILTLEIETQFFVSSKKGKYQEFSLEIYESKPASNDQQQTTSSAELIYVVKPANYTRQGDKEPSINFTSISTTAFSSAHEGTTFGLYNGSIAVMNRFTKKLALYKVTDRPVLKIVDSEKDSSLFFMSRKG